MKNKIHYILIISIMFTLLFYKNSLGINTTIFTCLLLSYIYYFLKSNKLIKNKFGLLFMIPILILTSTYFVYDNYFKIINIIVIPILYLFLYLFTIKPVYEIQNVIDNMISLVFEPLSKIRNILEYTKDKISNIIGLNQNLKSKLKSFLIILPVVIIVLILLSSADIMFSKIFSAFDDLLSFNSFITLYEVILMTYIMYMYLGAVLEYLNSNYKKKEDKIKKEKEINSYTIKLLLTILNVIYIIFDIIQIKYLLLQKLPSNITYATYAREGFFQLMIISFINFSIILLSKRSKDSKYTKYSLYTMCFLTLIIIISSIYRMYLYETAFGYTFLRLLVYVILFTEIILLIPTVIYIKNKNFKIVKYYIIITVSVYSFINLFSPDKIIAQNNINRYNKDNKIDIDYLLNYNYDNISNLKELYKSTNDEIIKKRLKDYFEEINYTLTDKNIFEFNLSLRNAKQKLEKLD